MLYPAYLSAPAVLSQKSNKYFLFIPIRCQ